MKLNRAEPTYPDQERGRRPDPGAVLQPADRAAGPRRRRRCKRLFIFHTQPCDTGVWKPTGIMGESTFTLPEMWGR